MWHASIPKIASVSTIPSIAPWKSRLGRLASLRRWPIHPLAGGLAVGGWWVEVARLSRADAHKKRQELERNEVAGRVNSSLPKGVSLLQEAR